MWRSADAGRLVRELGGWLVKELKRLFRDYCSDSGNRIVESFSHLKVESEEPLASSVYFSSRLNSAKVLRMIDQPLESVCLDEI